MKTITELAEEYINHSISMGRSREWIRLLRIELPAFAAWLQKARSVSHGSQLDRDSVCAWQRYYATRRSRFTGEPLKSTSVNRAIGNVRGFLIWISTKGCVPSGVANSLVYLPDPHRALGNTLSHANVRRVLRHFRKRTPMGSMLATLAEFLYSTGVRISEALHLGVDDIDLQDPLVRIHGKGDKERMVPIGRRAVAALSGYLDAVRPLLVADASERALWINSMGRKLRPATVVRHFGIAGERAGLARRFTPHVLRRSCATELVRGGANLWHVKDLMGHEDLEQLNRYVNLTIEDIKKTHARCHPRDRLDHTLDIP